MSKLSRSFYQQPAQDVATAFLGKYLVHTTPAGVMSGIITEIEAYPAFSDDVSHGNKKTKRTKIMYEKGGFAYVYLIYGIHYQFAVVVNKKDIPEVVFIRAVYPVDGIELMQENFNKEVKKVTDLTKSPGNLCKAFGITMDMYGEDLCSNRLFIEDRGINMDEAVIKESSRVGINKKLEGSSRKLRYSVDINSINNQ